MTINIKYRRGFIDLPNEMVFENPNSEVLQAVFSNFYPIGVVETFQFGYNSKLRYFGYSPHFDEVFEGEETPGYKIIIKTNEAGEVWFDRVIKMSWNELENNTTSEIEIAAGYKSKNPAAGNG